MLDLTDLDELDPEELDLADLDELDPEELNQKGHPFSSTNKEEIISFLGSPQK